MSAVRRDLAIGLSLATLWFIGIWSDLLPFLYLSDRYPIGALPCWNDFAAVVLNVAALGLVFALAGQALRRSLPAARAAGEWLLLASLAVPLNAIRNHVHAVGRAVDAATAALGAAGVVLAGLLVAAALVRWRHQAARLVIVLLVVMAPLVPVTMAQAAWAIGQAHGRMQCAGTGTLAAPLAGTPSVRVLWVVYDELEQYAAFEARSSTLRLPELDRLRAESLTATAAVPPGDRTERSMPGFVLGVPVADAALVGRNQLELRTWGDAALRPWAADQTIFARARGLGVNAAVAGFFLPYCALAGRELTLCSWQPCVTCGRMVGAYGDSVWQSMVNQASELAPRYGPRRHLTGYRALQAAALDLASNPTIGFALLHLPVPHDPRIYDRASGDFSTAGAGPGGYDDNLALADRSFGELRRAMEQSGTWDRTTIFVFGDHGRRSLVDGVHVAHPGVPFIARLAGHREPLVYASPFNLALVYDLTQALLSGRASTADEVAAWLDAHRGRWPLDTGGQP